MQRFYLGVGAASSGRTRHGRSAASLADMRHELAPPPSLWTATAAPGPSCPALVANVEATVCIIGGGYTGLSAAVHLAEDGIDTVVLEAAEPGWGASGRNGGQVIPGLKVDPDELERRLGPDRATPLIAFAASAPDRVFELIERHAIDCQAQQCGWIQAVHAPAALARVEARCRQWERRGAPVEMLGRARASQLLGTDGYVAGMLDARGGKLQPLAFARGLARVAAELGARVHGATPATALASSGDRWTVSTPVASVTARQVLICTNAYTGRLWPGLAQNLVPACSYQIATRPLSENVLASILPEGHVASDTRRLLQYFRTDPSARLLVGGRGRFGETSDPAHYGEITATLRRLFPHLGEPGIAFHWSGQVAMTVGHLPRLLRLAPGVHAAFGYNGRGIALASAAGEVLARLAAGGDPRSLPLPVTESRPIPLHRLRRPALRAIGWWRQLLDGWESRQTT